VEGIEIMNHGPEETSDGVGCIVVGVKGKGDELYKAGLWYLSVIRVCCGIEKYQLWFMLST
jgi:hypothetical protein